MQEIEAEKDLLQEVERDLPIATSWRKGIVREGKKERLWKSLDSPEEDVRKRRDRGLHWGENRI